MKIRRLMFLTLLLTAVLSKGYAQCSFNVVSDKGSMSLSCTLFIYNDEDKEVLKKNRPDGKFDLSDKTIELSACVRYVIKPANPEYWPIDRTGAFPCNIGEVKARKKLNMDKNNYLPPGIQRPEKF